jgi:hypothetical protein
VRVRLRLVIVVLEGADALRALTFRAETRCRTDVIASVSVLAVSSAPRVRSASDNKVQMRRTEDKAADPELISAS